MTLATATIERFTETTAALSPVTETPVTRNPTREEANRSGSPFDTMLYVTRIDSGDERHGDVTNTVVTVTASPSRDGWFRRNEHGNLQRLYGAPLNPEMVDGHYYRSLGNRDMLVRFNDEEHRGDRHTANLPLSIIASEGSPWPFPNDSMGMWENIPYIEVQAPTPVAVTAPPAGLTDAHQFVVEDTSVNGPTRGMAAAEADGRVLLNPAPEVGGMYLFWTTGRDWTESSMVEARIVEAITDGEPVFGYLGYWAMELYGGERVPYFYTSRRTILDSGEPKGWAKLALTVPEPTNTDTSTLQRTMNTEGTEFTEFNEATNTLAEDNDWCSEYEGIVERLGMEGRTKSTHDYDVDVAVDFTFEADSVSGRIDSLVADDYNIPGISLNSARFRGTVTVTIRVSDRDDADDASDYIDSDAVRDELSNTMSGADDIEIDDWSVSRTREVD